MPAKDKSHLVSLKVHIQCNISFSCLKSPRQHYRRGSFENLNHNPNHRHGYHITANMWAIFYHGYFSLVSAAYINLLWSMVKTAPCTECDHGVEDATFVSWTQAWETDHGLLARNGPWTVSQWLEFVWTRFVFLRSRSCTIFFAFGFKG